MTSNIGSSAIQESGGVISENVRKKVLDLMQGTFKPEFINRIDDVVVFNALDKDMLN